MNQAIIYGSFLAISIIYLIVLLLAYRKHISCYYVLLCVATIIISLGYTLMATSTSLQEALVGNKVIYLGSTFVPFFLILCISELCNVRLFKPLIGLFAATGLFIFGSVMMVGKSNLFYKTVSLERRGDYYTIVKDYGPVHMIYILYLFALIAYGVTIVIYSKIHERNASIASSTLCLMILIITVLVYIVQKIVKSNFEWSCLAFIIDFFLVLLQLRKIKLYDLAGFSGMTMESTNEYGFVICDTKKRFAGADGFARRTFPELNDLKIDAVVEAFDTDFLAKLQGWMNGEETDYVTCFKRNGKHIEARYSDIVERNGRVVHCVRLHDDTKHHEYMELIEKYNENLKNEVDYQTRKLRRVQDDIIISMASIVENRDNNTGGHIQRTSDIVKIFVDHLMKTHYMDALTPEIANSIIKAAPLHDFGKIAISDEVLNKPGKFTPEEYEIMKTHSAKGATIVARILQHSEDIQFKNIAVNVAHYHHEKWDGTGYPEGLSKKEIPFEARVMALADVFDALVSKRVYKSQMSYDKAFSIIEESLGTHFDPNLCEKFLECRPALEKLYDSYMDE